MTKWIFPLLLLVLSSCSLKQPPKRLPDLSLIKPFTAVRNGILYQYYEKFGFTDVCVHYRSYFRTNRFSPTQEWLKLPISPSDISKINSISNKVDKLTGKSFPILYQNKAAFSDISLESEEYVNPNLTDKTIDLTDGYYSLSEKSFMVYDNKRKTVYVEYHDCDGK
jgi:hypothetical protein